MTDNSRTFETRPGFGQGFSSITGVPQKRLSEFTEMPKTDWLTTRAQRAWQLRQSGLTYSEIGEALGQLGDPSKPISRTGARHLVQRWEARLGRPEGIPVTMSERAYNVLRAAAERAGERVSKQFARKLIETEDLLHVENCGAITLEEINDWANA